MNKKKYFVSESGQVIVFLALIMVGLLMVAGLAIDGGNIYTVERSAQAAADNAVMAAAYTRSTGIIDTASLRASAVNLASANGFTEDNVDTWVQFQHPPASGRHAGDSDYMTVVITQEVETVLAHLLYQGPWRVKVQATGHGVDSRPAGGSSTIHGGGTHCTNTIDWSGSATHIEGGLHSNRDITISGSSGNTITGTTTYVNNVNVSGSIKYVPAAGNPTKVAAQPWPVSFTAAEFAPGSAKAVAAAAAGEYFYYNGKMDVGVLSSNGWYNASTGAMKSGVYYATGDIVLGDSNMFGNVTLVSRRQIFLSGSNQFLWAYRDGLLLYSDWQAPNQCSDTVISVGGSGSQWNGIIFAPNGKIEINGSANATLAGVLIGHTVKLNGSNLYLKYDAALFPYNARYSQLVQ
jgi:hypothetical protein